MLSYTKIVISNKKLEKLNSLTHQIITHHLNYKIMIMCSNKSIPFV